MNQPFFTFDDKILALSYEADGICRQPYAVIEETAAYNACKVLSAFQKHRVGESHFAGTTGYGYGDRGRDTLDAVFATVFGAEDALVRHHFVSGTKAITTALFGVLRPGDKMVSVSGTPYDTLHAVLGLRGKNYGSLKDFGIQYEEIALRADGRADLEKIPSAVKGAKVAYLQRSRGYSLRPSITIDEIETIAKIIKIADKNAIFIVDNCYGEFVEKREPTGAGADLIVGSLIKNPGGGIARTGGYIAGRADLIELCAHRMTSPGTGREVGCSLDETRNMYMGLFFAPEVTAAALKTAVFAAAVFSKMGYRVLPAAWEYRTDVIQAVVLKSRKKLSAFCRGIQRGAPVDSFVTPEAWEMPGYDDPVIMAAGAFHMGASIELSADGPVREPYAAWMQGGLNFHSGKMGVLLAAQRMREKGMLLGQA
jgi:cystathionine beta-lyase family protein involved in aluminum resistance